MNRNIKKILNKKNKSKLVCLTAYSKNIASILDKHCDIILVGDSLGSVLYNYKSTKEVSLNTMISHSRSVRLGVKKSLMVVDMPFNTYRNPKEALKNAKLVMKKTKCDAVKLEGGKKILSIVKKLVKNKIPVMGHLGILPQTDKKFTFKGKKSFERNRYFEKVCKFIKKNKGIFITIDYGYYKNIKNFTLQSLSNHKFSNIFDNIGQQDISSHVNFKDLRRIAKKYNLKIDEACSQRDFLTKYGILERKELLSKNKNNETKNIINNQVERLVGTKEMGELFKFIIVSNL